MKSSFILIVFNTLLFCNIHAQALPDPPSRIIEIRSYNLKPGTRGEFQKLFIEEALPMLRRWNVEVVSYGPSLHDENTYFLIRAYASLEDRQKSQDDFYGSEEWRKGPRESILALIENYTTIVVTHDFLKKSVFR
jgi:hypothetical protein